MSPRKATGRFNQGYGRDPETGRYYTADDYDFKTKRVGFIEKRLAFTIAIGAAVCIIGALFEAIGGGR